MTCVEFWKHVTLKELKGICFVYGNYGLFHGPPNQNIYPFQFVPSNPHLELPRFICQNLIVKDKLDFRL